MRLQGLSLRRKLIAFVTALIVVAGLALVLQTYLLNRSSRLLIETNITSKAMRWLTMASISNHALARDVRALAQQYAPERAPASSAQDDINTSLHDLEKFVSQSAEMLKGDPPQEVNLHRIDKNLQKLGPATAALLAKLSEAKISQADALKAVDEMSGWMADIDDNVVLAIIKASESGEASFAQAQRARWISWIVTALAALTVLSIGWAAAVFSLRLARQLARMAQSLRASSETVSVASGEIFVAGEKVSASARQQVDVSTNSRGAIDDFTRMLAQLSSVSKESGQNVEIALVTAAAGKSVMDDLSRTMAEWNLIILEMQEIREFVTATASKTRAINDIVFKCEILSFNAAIEAARAGRHGLGFAVVAQEVGALARASGQAATEISRLLEQNEKRASHISTSIEKRVAIAQEAAVKCRQSFESISKTVESFVTQIKALEETSTENIAGISQMKKSSEATIAAAKGNSQSATQVFDLTPRLMAEADGLLKHVNDLDSLVTGKPKTKQG